MLIYFHKNKCRYEKGQLAPVFIVVLAVIIIMALVTVNIGKVALTKTQSANAVDSASISAGAIMANLFNSIGKSNRNMEERYNLDDDSFFETVSGFFEQALSDLTDASDYASDSKSMASLAKSLACSVPCVAKIIAAVAIKLAGTGISYQEAFISDIEDDIIPEVQDYHDKTNKFYEEIRDTAEEGRKRAITYGHKFVFMNSGIGAKLKEKSLLTSKLNEFTGSKMPEKKYDFKWTDGESREHIVDSTVGIQLVDTFDLVVTRNTFSAEMELLEYIAAQAKIALQYMKMAKTMYQIGRVFLALACAIRLLRRVFCRIAKVFLQLGIKFHKQALDTNEPLFGDTAEAWEKLEPNDQLFRSSADKDAEDQILCWIDEVIHDRLVRVETSQTHPGKDIKGLWKTQYPDTYSYSLVSFLGKGQIHHPWQGDNQGGGEGEDGGKWGSGPILRFNPSIIETDNEQGSQGSAPVDSQSQGEENATEE